MEKQKNILISILFFFSVSFSYPQTNLDIICKNLFSSVKVPILIIDSETSQIIEVNKAAVDFYGYSHEKMKELSISDINTKDDESVKKEIENVVSEKRNYFIFRHKIASGEIKDVEVYSSPVDFGSNKLLASFIHDITSRKEIEDKLKESETRLKSAESFAKFGHWVFSIESGMFYASRGAREIYGLQGDQWDAETIKSIPLPEYRNKLDKALKDLLTENIPYEQKFKIKRVSDGQILDISSIAKYDPQAKTVFGIIQDTTKETAVDDLLKRRTVFFMILLALILLIQMIIILFYLRENKQKKTAQDTLIEKSKEFDRFFSLKTDLLSIFDKKGKFLKVNNAFENIFGFSVKLDGNQNIYDYIDDEDILCLKNAVSELKNDGTSKTVEIRVKNKNAGFSYIEWKISMHGNLVYGIARDITERKNTEEKKLKMEKQILQTQKLESLGVLAGGIAHDFNNILMAILGHTELARMETNTSSPAFSNLREIETASKRASRLCNQMLAYTGRATFKLEKINISKIIEEMIHLVKTLITKKAVLNLSIDHDIPNINADPSQISQVIMNMIINSSDAIGDKNGVISISTGTAVFDSEYLSQTEMYDNLEAGRYVFFEISDTGSGILPEDKKRIFEPFFTTKFTGRGLGLAAVLGIVKSHKGSIKVYSEKDRGSNFKVLFPAVDDEYIENDKGNLMSLDEWRGSGTVLFVDDEESLRFLGKHMLERLGFDVITAVDGIDAVEIFKKRKDEIDLVLLDLTMPNMDGSQAFSEIRNIKESVKVVIASGYSYNDVIARFSGKNLIGIIQKPYTMENMREMMKKL